MTARNRRYFTNEEKDKGYAWVVLVAAFLITSFEMGNYSMQGVFFIEYLEYFQASKVDVAIIGTLCVFFFGLSGLFLGPVITRCGERSVSIFGSVLAAVCFIISYLAPFLPVLVICMGVGIGTACGCQCMGGICVVMRCFDKRLSLAIALQSIGFCLGGFVFPLIASALIEAYSWRGALFVLGAIQLNGIVFGLLFRPAEPDPDDTEQVKNKTVGQKILDFLKECFDISLLKRKRLLIHFISLALIISGETVPYMYLPSRGFVIEGDRKKAALLVAIMGLASTFVRPFVGLSGDALKNYKTLIMALASVTAGTLMVVSYFFTTFASLVVLALFYGILSAVFMVFLQSIIPDLSPSDKVPHAIGFAMLLLGLAAFISTPVSGLLVDQTGSFIVPFVVFGFVMIFGGSLSFGTFYLHMRYLRNQRKAESIAEMSTEMKTL